MDLGNCIARLYPFEMNSTLARYAQFKVLTDRDANANSDYTPIYALLTKALPAVQKEVNAAKGAVSGHNKPLAEKEKKEAKAKAKAAAKQQQQAKGE